MPQNSVDLRDESNGTGPGTWERVDIGLANPVYFSHDVAEFIRSTKFQKRPKHPSLSHKPTMTLPDSADCLVFAEHSTSFSID